MRIIRELKENWLFSKKNDQVPVCMPAKEGWEEVTLPHSWNAVDGMNGTPFERGAFWYVTSFTVPAQPRSGARVYAEIGAAGLVGEVFVNGSKAARHVGGYSLFRADLTAFLKEGENVLAICCDNRYSDKVYPQRADFTFYGGLYRHVSIISVPENHFSLDDHGGSGVYIDTEIRGGDAILNIRALVDGAQKGDTVSCQILDPEGKEVCEAVQEAASCTGLKGFVAGARLWDGRPGAPLYQAKLSLVSKNEVIDELTIPFGIRDFSVDGEKGFFLNGKPHPLRGVCRHQDRLWMGNALTDKEHREDAQIIAEMGANCVRLAHYQQAHGMYTACDELGLVVWAEIPYFAVSWDDDAHAAAVNEIKELVIQNYNHPSICFWGLSNEILMGQDHEKLMPCHEDLERAVKEIDQKRLTVVAHEFSTPWDHPLHELSDAEGWNHYFGWYRGTTEDFDKWLDEYHAKYPERRVAISEYGCDCVISYHSDNPVKMDYSEEYQAYLHEEALKTFAARPYIWGTFVWNMFDFGSSFRREGGTRGRNNKGLVTMDRKIRKDSFYVYKAWLSDDPFVHVDGRRQFSRVGGTTTVTVHSNQPEVSLYADGALVGTLEGEHRFCFENVPLSESGTVITAKAGQCEDTIILYGGEKNENRFVFPDFKESQDARNWFESVEEVVGTLEAKEGCFSVHDTVKDILLNEEALGSVLTCVKGAMDRVTSDDMIKNLIGANAEATIAEATDIGFLKMMLGKKREKVLRVLNSRLNEIHK